jgi:hypothetical protein
MGFGDERDLCSVGGSYGRPGPCASAEAGFRLNVPRAALVINDPQVDFLNFRYLANALWSTDEVMRQL